MIQIVPTILVKNFEEFKEKVKLLERDFPLAQIDVMDGKFVNNSTYFNIDDIEKIKTPLKYELHFMVRKPLQYIQKFQVSSSRFQVTKILFHYEAKSDIQKTLQAIKTLGCLAGLVINPETEVAKVKIFLSSVDCLMLMGVHPGASGQKFIPETVDKIKAVRAFHPTIDIEIDGGVNDKTAKALVEAGANILAVGSFVYLGKPGEQKEKILQSL